MLAQYVSAHRGEQTNQRLANDASLTLEPWVIQIDNYLQNIRINYKQVAPSIQKNFNYELF